MSPGTYRDKDSRLVTVKRTATGYTVRYHDTGDVVSVGDAR